MQDDAGITPDRIRNLSEAFSSFAAASGLLERAYGELQEKVRYLTVELEERNAQLKGVLQSMGEALVVLDRDGNVAMVNRAACGMLGPGAAAAAGRPFEALGCVLRSEGGDTVLEAGGRCYDVIASRSDVVDPSGAVKGSVLLIQDITRMKELEAQSERNRRLIRMGEMAAKIVHEIRSPLCSIELYATMLESELGEGESSRLSRGISSGILSVNNILTNMLLFARQQKPAMSRVDPSAVVDEALRLLEPMVGPRGILLERCAGGAPSLDGDPELLKQVLLNVVLNAVQATPGKGRVEVAVRGEGGGAVIAVSDDGEGIPEENLERIFDPFFSTKVKGTGLGLAIASRIMEAHGGFIRVRSAPGRGSEFELHFPPAGLRKEAAA